MVPLGHPANCVLTFVILMLSNLLDLLFSLTEEQVRSEGLPVDTAHVCTAHLQLDNQINEYRLLTIAIVLRRKALIIVNRVLKQLIDVLPPFGFSLGS